MEIILILTGLAAFALFVRWLHNSPIDFSAISDEALAEEVELARGFGESESPYYDESDRRAEAKALLERAK